ncbi:MAG: hypothetical protein J6B76_10055 [Peptococcaceae bacterium]|nr:hypothetical protein [Peptococcaceae bacterium]
MTTRAISRTGAKWIMPRYKREWQNICALLPAYLDDGTNGTVVTYLDGTAEAVAYRLCWVVDDLLLHLHTSREVLTKRSRMYLGKNARRVPLIASPQLCLVPVKGREALMHNDGTVGYLVLAHVQDVIPRGDTNKVYFTGGTYVTVYDTTRTLWENLNLTKEMSMEMGEL